MILDAIFDNSKSTNIADITNSTSDNNDQLYALTRRVLRLFII
jgi:hypothetical protein